MLLVLPLTHVVYVVLHILLAVLCLQVVNLNLCILLAFLLT